MTPGLGAPLARGSRSTVHRWGPRAIAKVPLASTPDAWIEAEARHAVAVHAAGAPVPRCLDVTTIDGRRVSIYERVDGRSLWAHVVAAPTTTRRLARIVAELQAHLATLVPPVSLPAQRDRLTSKIRRAARERPAAGLDDALEAVPPAGAVRLCHGDLHPGNVLMGPDGPVLIDWFDASRGDPAADVARSMVLQRADVHGPAGPRHLPGATPELLAELSAGYAAAAAELLPEIAGVDLDRWVAVVAVSRVAEGVEPDGLVALWDSWRRSTGGTA